MKKIRIIGRIDDILEIELDGKYGLIKISAFEKIKKMFKIEGGI